MRSGIQLGILIALVAALAGCAAGGTSAADTAAATQAETAAMAAPAETAAEIPAWDDLSPEGTMPLEYAEQFTVQIYREGYRLLTIGEEQYLVVPEGVAVPEGTPDELVILQQPLDGIYLNASSAIDCFRTLDAVDTLRFSAFTEEQWYVQEAVDAMEAGTFVYAGKYSAPDYELLLDGGCDLSIESTMIYHKPEVQEQLESLGIPVLVERSSYESHPLGRMEWIKLYGVLLGKEAEAETYYAAALAELEPTLAQSATGKTVAYFYILPSGEVMVRNGGDYIAKSIALAGGTYVFADLEPDSSKATSTIQLEAFYDRAKDADVLIYNSSMGTELSSVQELLDQSPLLVDFKAIQDGNLWCTGKDLFQESLSIGGLIRDINAILTQEAPETQYLHLVP